MVAFETLLLGIVTGIVPVRLMVTAPVAAVEVRLDGTEVGVLAGPPWTIACDLGRDPMPHELTAIGRDTSGREVARAAQWANMGRHRAAIATVLERESAGGRPSAVRIAWNTLEAGPPPSVQVALDERPLPVDDPHFVHLPEVDLARLHVVSVSVRFSAALVGRAEIPYGGDVSGGTSAEMTPVAVALPPGQTSVAAAELAGALSDAGAPVEVAAVDEGPGEVAFVIAGNPGDATALAELRKASRAPVRVAQAEVAVKFYTFGTCAVRGTPLQYGGAGVFRRTSALPLEVLRNSIAPALTTPAVRDGPPRAADALAVAALETAGSNRRRAVVLVVSERGPHGTEADDASTVTVAGVRAYLAARTVPLLVWSLTGGAPELLGQVWRDAEDVATRAGAAAAERRLEARLAAQRIVWLKGRHLPQRIALDESRTDLRLAR